MCLGFGHVTFVHMPSASQIWTQVTQHFICLSTPAEFVSSVGSLPGPQYSWSRVHKEGDPVYASGRGGEDFGERLTH